MQLRSFLAPAVLVLSSLPAGAPATGQAASYDLLIRDGLVLDGTGSPGFRADVAVRGGRIAAIGEIGDAPARRVIHAGGRMIAPGIIDLHSHADDARPGGLRSVDRRRRAAPNLVAQGVTTVVVNQDGRSPWPIAEQRMQLARRGIGPNAVLLAGHGTLRGLAMGPDVMRPATAAEVDGMRRLLRRALAEGAAGLSAGLEYDPGRWSTTDELVALTEEVASRGGVFISHQRSEGPDPLWYLPSRDPPGPPSLYDAVRETIEIGERSGAVVVATHIKARGVDLWGASDSVIALVQAARDRGVRVYADVYPYTSSGSDGDTRLIPAWVFEQETPLGVVRSTPRGLLAAAATDPARAAALRADIAHEIRRRGGPDRLVVVDHPDPSYVGLTLEAVSVRMATTPVDAAIALQLEAYPERRGRHRIRGFSMGDADVANFARPRWVATASDAGIALPGDGPVHPRFYGTFPRALARSGPEPGAIPIEDAVRSMTSLPAGILGLVDRGLIRTGFAADLIVFDPLRLADTATFFDPYGYPIGIDYVFVGGVPVVDDGMLTWALPGAVLQTGRPASARP
jgi:N-acyl-D-amino-acid deacylase